MIIFCMFLQATAAHFSSQTNFIHSISTTFEESPGRVIPSENINQQIIQCITSLRPTGGKLCLTFHLNPPTVTRVYTLILRIHFQYDLLDRTYSFLPYLYTLTLTYMYALPYLHLQYEFHPLNLPLPFLPSLPLSQ